MGKYRKRNILITDAYANKGIGFCTNMAERSTFCATQSPKVLKNEVSILLTLCTALGCGALESKNNI